MIACKKSLVSLAFAVCFSLCFQRISTRLFKYNPNSAEQLAAIEGAVKDRREQAVVIPVEEGV